MATTPTVTCGRDPDLFLDPAQAAEAAASCERCPVVEACLRHALELDVAFRLGVDLYGATGTYGGVWFEPGHAPRALHAASSAARSAA